jgi:hypothetical protein
MKQLDDGERRRRTATANGDGERRRRTATANDNGPVTATPSQVR